RWYTRCRMTAHFTDSSKARLRLKVRAGLFLLRLACLLPTFSAYHSQAAPWSHATIPPCSLITGDEAARALGQPLREPVSHEYLSSNERDRKEIQGLVDQGVVSMSTCEYNGAQTGVPMDFITVYLYRFADSKKAEAFYKVKTKGSHGDAETLASLSGLCDKSCEMHGNASAEVVALNKGTVFSIQAVAGIPNANSPELVRTAVEALYETAVRRLK